MDALKYIWEGAIPLQIHLHESEVTTVPPPPPAMVLAPRIGYLPLLASQIKPYFGSTLPPGVDTIWFEYQGLPLKWDVEMSGELREEHEWDDEASTRLLGGFQLLGQVHAILDLLGLGPDCHHIRWWLIKWCKTIFKRMDNSARANRRIIDASLIANELIDPYFLSKTKGFGDTWRKWIMAFISSTNFSIITNGKPRGKIKAMNSNLGINHLQFLDDTILFNEEKLEIFLRHNDNRSFHSISWQKVELPITKVGPQLDWLEKINKGLLAKWNMDMSVRDRCSLELPIDAKYGLPPQPQSRFFKHYKGPWRYIAQMTNLVHDNIEHEKGGFRVEDTLRWKLDKSGHFTSKSFIHHLSYCGININAALSKNIWRGPIDWFFFLGKISHGRINTADVLNRLHGISS
ncbi:autophagy protein 5 isoform X2 [Cucumis melo var. makuwa]|uniref:Autophagy protein 5 isoform X2 n=1 Tax=Cucumis melo var. makuwa TaxID=1194695 RepID=A0A5D3CR53_CUCMM|nr:autophagy protein 5 isoform X2 [Cucumis melo var. makuwa]